MLFLISFMPFLIYSTEKIYNLNDIDYTNSNKKINNYKDSNLNEDFLQDNFEKNKDIKIGKEIKQKKYIISKNEFNNN